MQTPHVMIGFRIALGLFLLQSASFAKAEQLTSPTLISPSNNATINLTNSILLDWSTISAADTYRVQVIKESEVTFNALSDGSCSNCLINEKLSASQFSSTIPSGKYKWRVRAGHTTDVSLTASEWVEGAFAIRLAQPQLLNPVNTTTTLTPTFNWSSSSLANTYRIQISESSSIQTSVDGFDCFNCIVNEALTTNSYIIPNGKLENNKTYYWRVRAGSSLPDSDSKAIPDSGFTNVASFNTPITTSPQNLTINIESPTTASTFTINTNTISLSGTAANSSVIRWTAPNNQTGTATGTSNWQISNIALVDGDNLITVTAENSSGTQVADTITVTKTTNISNKEPILVSSSVSPNIITQNGNLKFQSIWKDEENNPIVDVRIRYRLVNTNNWEELLLDYESGSVTPTFSKTLQINKALGAYEFEVRASDVQTINGAVLHTTAWQVGGRFTIVANQEPQLISSKVSSSTITPKASLQFSSSWKDPDGNFIVNVKVRYRRDGGALGINYPWKEVALDYLGGNSTEAIFAKTVSIDEVEGPYEFEFQASDVEQLNGTALHTTAWQGLGQFSIVSLTNNQPPVLQLIAVPQVIKRCQPAVLYLQATDVNKNLKEIQVDWSGKGTQVTSHLVADGEVIKITSPVDNNNKDCPSELTNKPDTTYLKFTATAYDTVDASSKMVRAGSYVNRIPVKIVYTKKLKNKSLNPGICPCPDGITFVGDPVNVMTGSQVINLTLLSVDGVLPISFGLAYDSAILDTNGIVGKAWSSNLTHIYLEQTVENDVVIHWSENQYNTFFLQGDGSYFSSDNRTRFDSLVKNADGSFTLTGKNKAIYDFSPAGQLRTLLNPQGHSLVFEYNAAGKISKISEPISGVFLAYQYNSAGLLASVSDVLNRQVLFEYNSAGFLEKIIDAAKQTVTYSYDGAGRILKAVNSDNNVLFVNEYNTAGQVISQDDSNPSNQLLRFDYHKNIQGDFVTTLTQRDGSVRKYTYNGAYQPLSIVDELNQSVMVSYDDMTGLAIESVNAKGAKTQFKYDNRGNLTKIINAKAVETLLNYDVFDNLISMVDAAKATDSFVYDDKQLLVSASNALKQVTTMSYNAQQQLASIVSPKGNVTQFEYVKGLLSKVIEAEGQVNTIERDAAGRIVKMTDAEGHSTQLTWDAVNRLVAVTDALGRTLKMVYNARDKVIEVADAKGQKTYFEYDANGNLSKITNAIGESTRFEYDAEDRLIKVIDALNQVSQWVRDVRGRVIKTIDPLGHSQSVEYDALGNVLKQIDALGQVVATIDYDVLSNVIKATDALGNSANLEYDALNQVVKSINPLGKVTQYQHDVLGRLQSSIDALQGQSSQAFDSDGLLQGFKDANRHETQFVFDKSARLVEETTTRGGKVGYRYNARDLLVEVKNARGQVRSIQYDAIGRVTEWTDEVSTRRYRYDDNDNVLSVVDSVAGTVSFEYDALNRVVRYTDAQGNVQGYRYDAVGNLVELTYPDGKVVKYAYDGRGLLVLVTDWANRVTRYTRDANGRVIKEERPNKTVLTKSYDVLGRLESAQDINSAGQVIFTVRYRYDAVGNIVEEAMLPEPDMSKVMPMTMSYGVGNSLEQVNGQATNFDIDGNLLKAPLNGVMTDFVFNARNQLVSAAGLMYGYDALGYRDVVTEKGKSTRFVLNPVPALHQALVKIAPDGTKVFYVYGLGLIGEESAGEYQAYHFDYRGSTVALTSSAGAVVSRFGYEPYGGLVSHDASVASVTPFLFNGQYGVMTDTNGLYQMRARFYHPELRRFVNQDPVFLGSIAESQSLNRFAFVEGQPVSLVDPFGLEGTDLRTGTLVTDGKKDIYPIISNDNSFSAYWNNDVVQFVIAEDVDACVAMDGFWSTAYGCTMTVVTCTGGGAVVKYGWKGVAKGGKWVLGKFFGKSMLKNPKNIRFTQNSIGKTFKNEDSLEETIKKLKNGELSANDFPEIRIFEKDGKIYTLDNRRLYVFQQAGLDSIPVVEASADDIVKEAWKFTTKTDGLSIEVRGK